MAALGGPAAWLVLAYGWECALEKMPMFALSLGSKQ